MPRVLVVGGTGLAGRAVTAEAVERGHDVVVAARRTPDDDADAYVPGAVYVTTDLVTGSGLEEAVDGADVIVDASNGVGRQAAHVFAFGAQNLLHTAARFGVNSAVLLSVAGIDGSGYAYYRAKAEQERAYLDSPLETRVVRATQFHDFVTAIFERGRPFGTLLAPSRTRFQPIAVADVARVLVDAAEGAGEPGVRTVAGPRIESARELAEQWKRHSGSRRPVVPVRLGGALGATWRAGRNLAPEHAIDGIGYGAWLSSRAA
ncbi:NAD(P)H-binding protein [Leifsonia sp. F6_8S_P_1B]|uniref:NAD(P)H-binding protein n=1 Tax=Leifsonia williamsii TaxID=3035919 RepID=A0ABT8KC63_9MICO|nr:NAD(P)H-binding protein [Leifsonia williamsii]MDN4615051.1 NAD(P)H-binding protein [Leifsonia williamsii]